MYDIKEGFFVKQTKLCDNRFVLATFDEIEYHNRIITDDRISYQKLQNVIKLA